MTSMTKLKKNRSGALITFEGIEGSGKSTQLELFAEYLVQKGYSVVKTREPGGTIVGNALRVILLDPTHAKMTPMTELFVILASRAEHIAQLIKPAIADGKIVLCDRFYHATLAYQGYGRGLNRTFIEDLSRSVTHTIAPQITFLLDVKVSTAMARLARRGSKNRLDQETIAFHKRVHMGYLSLWKKSKRSIKKIEGDRSIEEVARKIQSLWDTLHV